LVFTKKWKEFAVEFPALFNDVFTYFVFSVKGNLPDYLMDNRVPVREKTAAEIYFLRDFDNLYKDMVFSDVELEVDGQVLKAHKLILMSRSSVFKAMFSHDTLEAAKNRVVIRDFDFKTIQELLRYIYCEKVENLDEIALDLMAAADYVSFLLINV
jgi:hypothetical protein